MAKYRDNTLDDILLITKALSDESRIRIFMALRKQELCVCQVVELLGLAPSTVSKHLSILKHAHVIKSRKQGRWIYYRVPEGQPSDIQAAVELLCKTLEKDDKIREDSQRIKEIVKIDPEELCKIQCQKVKIIYKEKTSL
ncbi:MAG TPA: metalloregulator ArsR/SmtB family transcription factor [Thermodesulfobacteriota bacterium]|nr:metalloregulator ArsR/SmtB family transcription factor [Thermodesulfobacteriota bacterium]